MTPKQEAVQRGVMMLAYKNHEKGLNARAFFKVSDRAIGEDLVQDTFTKTWKYLVRGGKIDVMKAFLYHILNDLIVDQYRKHKTVSLDVLDGKAALLLIGRLPERYQKVMRMRYVQDLSLEEMSLITGQSKNTIAVHAHRGLEKLKLLYKPT